MQKNKRIVFYCFLLLSFILEASNIRNIETFTSEDGFDQQGVFCAFQDSINQLWIGTEEGVMLYDGSRFQKINFEGIEFGKNIRAIKGGSDHSILIGTTQKGLFKISRKDTIAWNESKGFPSNHIRDVVEYKGDLWVATFSGGLVHIAADGLRIYDIDNKLPSNTVRALKVHQGILYVGTDFGLMKFDGVEWSAIDVGADFISSLILSLYSSGNELWIGSQKGLYMLKDGKAISVSSQKEIASARVKAIAQKENGNLLLGTRNGLILYKPSTDSFEIINEEDGLGGSRIRSLTKGTSGQVWIGTYFGGLSLLISDAISLNDDTQLGGDNAYDKMYAFGETKINSLYNAGFVFQNQDTAYHAYVANGLSGDVVTGAEWVNDSTYIVATQEGLNLFVKHHLQRVYDQYNMGFSSSNFEHLNKYDQHFIGILDNGELLEFDLEEDSLRIIKKSTLPSGVVINDVQYYNGALWLAGAKGIYKYLPAGSVLKVHDIRKEVTQLFEWQNQLYGLNSDNSIETIDEIGIKQRFHFAVENQITWIQPTQKALFFQMNDQILQLNSEGELNIIPLSSAISKVKAFPFASRIIEDKIQVGTVSGELSIDLNALKKTDASVFAKLSDISNEFNQIDWVLFKGEAERVLFPSDYSQLTFSVKSSELVYPQGVMYRFKLDGEDDEFVSTLTSSKITYSGLSSGEYNLWVQCKPPMGDWSKPQIVISFEIETPIYKNPWIIGGVLILLVAVIYAFVWVRTKRLEIEKAKLEKIVQERTFELSAEKQKTDELLLNILPSEIAEELKRNGSAEARGYEKVSILFTDFKGFTTISGKVPPKELVKDLDEIFAAFDDIVAKHDLEKIKTIGDAYMCVGGVPNVSENHAQKAILVGKDMVAFMETFNKRKRDAGADEWLIRVGIHSGPIVAGVVGKSKFAYDVWGDSVNVASRMESSSEPGRINVSAETYELAKEDFEFEYRGALQAKNKGDLDMYFVR